MMRAILGPLILGSIYALVLLPASFGAAPGPPQLMVLSPSTLVDGTLRIVMAMKEAQGDYSVREFCIHYTRTAREGNTSFASSPVTKCTGPHVAAYKVALLEAGMSQWIKMTGLDADSNYKVTATVITTMGITSSTSKAIYVNTPPIAPSAAPTNLHQTGDTDTSISIQWDPIPFLKRNGRGLEYIVEVRRSSSDIVIRRVRTTSNTATLTSLNFASSYDIRVAGETSDRGPYAFRVARTTYAVPSQPKIHLHSRQQYSLLVIASPGHNWYRVSTFCVGATRTARQGDTSYRLSPVTKCAPYGSTGIAGTHGALFSFTGLTPDSEYTLAVTAKNQVGSSRPNLLRTTTKGSAPSVAPTNLRQTGSTAGSITLQWDPIPFMAQNGRDFAYFVDILGAKNNTYTRVAKSRTTSVTLNSRLAFDTAYRIRVAAIQGAYVGPYSSVLVAWTGQNAPGQPQIRLGGRGPTSQVFFIDRGGFQYSVSMYCVQLVRKAIQGDTSRAMGTITKCENGATIQISGLSADSDYLATATVNNTLGATSIPSKAIGITTLPTAPSAAPANLRQTGSTSTTITLQWDPIPFQYRNGRHLKYIIAYTQTTFTEDQSVWRQSATSSNTVTLSKLTFGTDYTVHVSGQSINGALGPRSTVRTQTDTDAARQPSIQLYQRGLDYLEVLVTRGGAYYHVSMYCAQITRTARQGNTSYASIPVTRCSTGSSNYAIISLTGLTPDSDYTITATVNSTLGITSPPSKVLQSTTLTAAPSAAPTNIRQTGSTATTITLQWDPIPFLKQNSRRISYSLKNGDRSLKGISSTKHTLNGLSFNSAYKLQVAAVSANGEYGPWSDDIKGTTKEDAPILKDIVYSWSRNSKDIGPITVTRETGHFHISSYCIVATRLSVNGNTSYSQPPTTQCHPANGQDFQRITFKGARAGSAYNMSVFAINSKGARGPGTRAQVVSPLLYMPFPPTNLRTTSVGIHSISLSWDALPALLHDNIEPTYHVYTSLGYDTPRLMAKTTQTTAQVLRLVYGTQYRVQVSAVYFGFREGPLSKAIYVTTKQDIPKAPFYQLYGTTATTITALVSPGFGSYVAGRVCFEATRVSVQQDPTYYKGKAVQCQKYQPYRTYMQATFTGALPSSTYQVSLYVENTAGVRGPSTAVTSTTTAMSKFTCNTTVPGGKISGKGNVDCYPGYFHTPNTSSPPICTITGWTGIASCSLIKDFCRTLHTSPGFVPAGHIGQIRVQRCWSGAQHARKGNFTCTSSKWSTGTWKGRDTCQYVSNWCPTSNVPFGHISSGSRLSKHIIVCDAGYEGKNLKPWSCAYNKVWVGGSGYCAASRSQSAQTNSTQQD